MKIVWKNKFIFWNLVALIFIKAAFSYSSPQFASLINGVTAFAKEEVIAQTNTLRQTLGLSTLKESTTLDIAAAQKLQDMIEGQYFAHTSPAGVSPWHWIEVNQYKYTYAGENLAIGFSTAKDAVDAWANSPLHRANLLNSKYKEIGIAIAPAKIQNSRGFLVVQLFGTPKPTAIIRTVVPLKPLPTPLAVRTPAVTPVVIFVSPAVHSANQENVEQPIASKINNVSPGLNRVALIFNSGLILYALLAFFVSLLLLAFRGLKRGLVIRTAASFAILVLALVVPVLQITHIALVI